MQKRAKFDDRIRNLIALAQDGTPHSRTLLFSHISDLFLQRRPMASAAQARMLIDILKELLSQVDIAKRQEVAQALCALDEPPEALVNLICEDIVEVSGPLLEKANLPDDRLIHIIRYGTDAHRIHISRRFGLSPLVRQELDKAQQNSSAARLKFSLNDLEKRAEDQTPDLDEETTTNLLELLRAQNIHPTYPDPSGPVISPDIKPKTPHEDTVHFVKPSPFTPQPEMLSDIKPDMINVNFTPFSKSSVGKGPAEKKTDAPAKINHGNEKEPSWKEEEAAPSSPIDIALKDSFRPFPATVAANDALFPESTIKMGDAAPDLVEDIWQQARDARHETNKQREFVRTVADWFWEVDRIGTISFLSEEAFTVFGRPPQSLIGEDFISLCRPRAKKDAGTKKDAPSPAETLESLFERRSSFRNIPFDISSAKGEKSLWYLSAIAIFDIHTGRFTGFRGSARSEDSEEAHGKINPAGHNPVKAGPVPDRSSDAKDAFIPHKTAASFYAEDTRGAMAADTTHSARDEVAAELLHNLSHEFRTPLNAIIGFSEMIDMETWGPVNPQYHQHTKNILAAAGQLKEAVNDVLDSAKLEAGLFQISPESFSLKSVMKNSMENVASLAEKHHVHLSESGNNIDVILYNDKQSVELCLTKMLSGIIKSAFGGETITPSVLINSNAQVRIELPVLGPEIRAENQQNLFQKLKTEPDEQKNSLKSDHEYAPKISSNYGLSIARDLALMIGGDISSHISQGKITHLVLTLSNHDLSS